MAARFRPSDPTWANTANEPAVGTVLNPGSPGDGAGMVGQGPVRRSARPPAVNVMCDRLKVGPKRSSEGWHTSR